MPRYVVIARDPLLAEEGAQARLPSGVLCERQYGSDLSIDSIFSQLAVANLFAEQRAYHYVDIHDFKLLKKDGERLKEILSHLPPELTLVCSQVVQTETRGEEDRLLKGADFKLWCEGAEVDDLRAHSEGEQALQWLKQRATQRYRLALTKEQLKKVLLLSADSLALADTELYKLSLLKAADKLQPVPDSVLKANLSDNPAARFYELVDAIMLEQPDAQELLARLHGLNPDPHRLVAELRRRFLGLLALERGGEVQPPYLARQLRPLAGRWRGPRLSRAIQALAALEHGLKSGAYMGESSRDAELAGLQLFIRELTA